MKTWHPNTPEHIHKDPQEAFRQAIERGTLDAEEESTLFAGNFMYMHTDMDGNDHFKNIITRQYIK